MMDFVMNICRIAKGVACHHRRKRDLLRTQGKSLHTSTRSRLTQTPHTYIHTHTIEHLLPIIYVQFIPLPDAVSYVTVMSPASHQIILIRLTLLKNTHSSHLYTQSQYIPEPLFYQTH